MAKYNNASIGELRSAAFHDAMADVHGMISLDHGDRSMQSPKGSHDREFHNSVANAHAMLSEHQFKMAKAGVYSGKKSMNAKVTAPRTYGGPELRN